MSQLYNEKPVFINNLALVSIITKVMRVGVSFAKFSALVGCQLQILASLIWQRKCFKEKNFESICGNWYLLLAQLRMSNTIAFIPDQ